MVYREKLRCGCIYHIYNRGNNKESLFKEERNYYYFLELYKKYLHPIVYLYAYCLLPTHFHLMVRIKEWNEIENCLNNQDHIWMQFRTFLGTYTKAINKAYQRTGHLFESRYSRKIIQKDQYFYNLIAYIHQNPENHGIVLDYRNWPFSSYDAYLRKDRRSMIAKELLLNKDIYNTIMGTHELESFKKISDSVKGGNGFL